MTNPVPWRPNNTTTPAPLAHRHNFVAPDPQPIVRRVSGEILPPDHSISAPVPVQHDIQMHTSHVDRAKGFTIVSLPMAVGVGVGGLLLAVGLGAVPLFSMGALLVLFLSFLLTWLTAWIWHTSASPDGVALWTVLLHYRILSREQKARLRRMERDIE